MSSSITLHLEPNRSQEGGHDKVSGHEAGGGDQVWAYLKVADLNLICYSNFFRLDNGQVKCRDQGQV